MKPSIFRMLPLAVAGVFLFGCAEEEGPAERAGARLDDAIDSVRDRAEEVADDVEERAQAVREAIEDAE